MYFLDTGSTDGTFELIQEHSKLNSNIIIEKYHQSFIPEYNKIWEEMESPFPEVEVRNFALKQVEKVFNLNSNDWLIQLDGDEIFLPETKNIINNLKNDCWAIGHSTINPVCELKWHPQEIRHKLKLYDPHARIWKASLGIKYQKNPTMKNNQFHSIPTYNNKHLFNNSFIRYTDIPIHFHLHWMFGKKIEGYYFQKNVVNKQNMISNQFKNEFSSLLHEDFWETRETWIKS
jgi:hypothetical protein